MIARPERQLGTMSAVQDVSWARSQPREVLLMLTPVLKGLALDREDFSGCTRGAGDGRRREPECNLGPEDYVALACHSSV
jgi:hypothetical protein